MCFVIFAIFECMNFLTSRLTLIQSNCVLQVVASLQAQLEQRKREVEQKDLLFQNVTQETQNLRNQLDSVSTRCRSLETQLAVGQLA